MIVLSNQPGPFAFFEEKQIRRNWDQAEEKCDCSIGNVVRSLTDSANVKDYIKKLRKRHPDLDAYWGANYPLVAIHGTEGRIRPIRATNAEAQLKIIQSIPSFKTESFELWLAKVGYEHRKEIEKSNCWALPTQLAMKLFFIIGALNTSGLHQFVKLPSRKPSKLHGLSHGQFALSIKRHGQLRDQPMLQRGRTCVSSKRRHFLIWNLQGDIHTKSLAATWMGGKFQWEFCEDASNIQPSNQLQRCRARESAGTPPTQALGLTKLGEKLGNQFCFEVNANGFHSRNQWGGVRDDAFAFGDLQDAEAAHHIRSVSGSDFASKKLVEQNWYPMIQRQTNGLRFAANAKFVAKRYKHGAGLNCHGPHPFAFCEFTLNGRSRQPALTLSDRFSEYSRWHPNLIEHRSQDIKSIYARESDEGRGVGSANWHKTSLDLNSELRQRKNRQSPSHIISKFSQLIITI